MGTIDDYLAGLPAERADPLRAVLAAALAAVPGAEQGTSYGMPALMLHGRPLLGFQSAARHLAVYPFSPAAVAAVSDRLPPRSWSKGTVRFVPTAGMPADVVGDLVRARAAEIDADGAS